MALRRLLANKGMPSARILAGCSAAVYQGALTRFES